MFQLEVLDGEDIYACNVCDQGFDRENEIKKHILECHEEIILEIEKDMEKEPEINDESGDEKDTTGGYDYLLRLQFRSITEERINKLKNDIASKIKGSDLLTKKSEKDLWISDLDEFEKAYVKWQ